MPFRASSAMPRPPGDCRNFRANMEDMGDTEEISRAIRPELGLGPEDHGGDQGERGIGADEAEFGKGSALKVDYPFNRGLIRHVHIRPEETKAKGGLIPK